MRHAWQRADGIDSDDLPSPRLIDALSFKEVAEVAVLTLNQPTPQNDGTLKVPYNLRFYRHESREVTIKSKGKPVTVTMDIGLTKPMFVVESKYWQPVQDTIFRGRPHVNVVPGPVADFVVIVQPKGNHGCVVGEPLTDEAHIVMEKTGAGDDGPIMFSVKVPRDGISVVVPEGNGLSATQKDVLDAIFASSIPRDTNNRLTVESVSTKPPGAQSAE